MEARCKNCKYFTYSEDYKHFDNHNSSKFYANSEKLGNCNNDKVESDATSEGSDCLCKTDGIFATCDEARGDLIIGEDFGCIHFEPKETV